MEGYDVKYLSDHACTRSLACTTTRACGRLFVLRYFQSMSTLRSADTRVRPSGAWNCAGIDSRTFTSL